MSGPRKWLLRIGIAVIALVLIAAAGLVVIARAPLPKYDGELQLAGLNGEVTIRRDELGVPHIHASTDRDLMFAQGFVHAQDRFFQMDLRRHITAGRLSELVGEGGKESDIAVRTMGFRRVAEQDWEQLSDETRGLYEAYAAGVNAHIRDKAPWQIANEYTVLGLTVPFGGIEPWTPVDSLAWLKAMSNSLSASHGTEAGNMALLKQLGSPGAVEELFPVADEAASRPIVLADGVSNLRPRGDYPIADPLPLPEVAATEVDCPPEVAAEVASGATPNSFTDAVQAAQATVKKVAGSLGEGHGIGSNSFVIGGQHTASGKPILGNDPHLDIDHPSVWSQVGLHCTGDGAGCTFDVEGFSFAGMPGVLIGRNPDLAWAFTNLGGDVSDLVVERNVGENAYLRDGKCLAYTTRTETIQVAGGEPVELTVKESVHGPVISDLLNPDANFAGFPNLPGDFSVALQWVALIPSRTAEAIFDLNRASDAAGVAAAAAKFSDPAQNILFATTAGDIGYQAPGLHPIRPIQAEADQNHGLHGADALGADGRWPRPGWDSSYDWQGFYAPEDMPAVLNPPDGIIVPANQPVTPKDSGPFLDGWYFHGYRSQAMYDELVRMAEAGPISEEQAWQVMLLDRFPGAETLGKAFTSVKLADPRLREQQEVLRGWLDDGAHMAVEEPGAAIMAALFAHLADQVLGDELREYTFSSPNTLEWLVSNPGHRLWDDQSTPGVEDADAILRRTWAAADADLTAQLGTDHSAWSWGKVHVETPTHQVLGGEGVPGPVRWYFNRGSQPVGGTGDAPNASWFNPQVKDGRVDYEVISGGSMRMTVDLADLDAAHWSTSSGVSGHPLSKHYDDQFATWAAGGRHPWPFTREAIEATTKHRLVLRPA
ncbi:penicillin acylase family protein [Arachnia propionica]|nr:penicillin acylase family protein [Arachnia propionica]